MSENQVPPHPGSYAPSPPPTPQLDDLEVAPAILDFIHRLEKMVLANQRDARRDHLFFWLFKLPTIVSSAAASVTAFQGLQAISAFLALTAAVTSAVDSPIGAGTSCGLRDGCIVITLDSVIR